MLARRLVHGLWFDTIGLILFSALFTGLMALLGVQLYLSLRSRVELGETAVRITLPQSAGATPMLHFINKEIPYDKIAAVETRCVLFGNAMAPVLLRATRLLLKDGEHVRLGNVNEDNVDSALPFPEIGAKIAQRAGVEVVDARNGAPLDREAGAQVLRPQDAARGEPTADARRRSPRSTPATPAP